MINQLKIPTENTTAKPKPTLVPPIEMSTMSSSSELSSHDEDVQETRARGGSTFVKATIPQAPAKRVGLTSPRLTVSSDSRPSRTTFDATPGPDTSAQLVDQSSSSAVAKAGATLRRQSRAGSKPLPALPTGQEKMQE